MINHVMVQNVKIAAIASLVKRSQPEMALLPSDSLKLRRSVPCGMHLDPLLVYAEFP